MDSTQRALLAYVEKASELAEAVRKDIQANNGAISNKTVLALNEFIIAANMIKDLTDVLEQDTIKLN